MKKIVNFLPFCIILGMFFGLGTTTVPGVAKTQPTPIREEAPYSKPIAGVEPEVPAELSTKLRSPVGATADLEGVEPNANFWAFAGWNRVVFQAWTDGNWELFTNMNDQVTRLTYTVASDNYPDLNNTADRIAFNSNMAGSHDIFAINVDGGALTRLTFEDSYNEYDPSWSPDSKRIAYVSNKTGVSDIYIMNSDGTGSTRLTTSQNSDFNPAFSPDGKKIAYVTGSGDYGQLMVMNADGSAPQALSGALLYMAHPAWSPDGKKIAFDADADNDYFNELLVYDIESSEFSTLADGYNNDYWLGNWSSNGFWLTLSNLYYTLMDGVYHLDTISLKVMDIEYKSFIGIYSYNFDALMPDAQSLDVLPPVTRINPLPEYTRNEPYTISVQGQDNGISGLDYYQLQYRVGEGGNWAAVQNAPFSEPGCNLVYFRARGVDHADNWEAWPVSPDWDAKTWQFDWFLSGQVTDNRGIPLVKAPMSIPSAIHPTSTDSSGMYITRMCDDNTAAISATRPGYGTEFGAMTKTMNADTAANFYLPPADSVIQNGGFEAALGLSEWTTEGTLDTDIKPGYSGVQAAMMGTECDGICLTDKEVVSSATRFEELKSVEDSQRNLHVVTSNFRHYMRNTLGEWSELTALPKPTGVTSSGKLDLEIDNQDTLHLLLKGSNSVFYLYSKPLTGTWTYNTLSGIYTAHLSVSEGGDVFIPYFTSGADSNFYLRRKNAGGTWLPDVLLDQHVYLGIADVYPEKNGDASVYAIYPYQNSSYSSIRHFIFHPNGSFESEVVLSGLGLGGGDMIEAQKTSDGITVLWYDHGYIYREPGGQWSGRFVASKALNYSIPTVGDDHIMRLFGIPLNDTRVLYYFSGRLGEPLVLAKTFNLSSFSTDGAAFTVAKNGNLQFVWADDPNLYYSETALAGVAEEGALSQVVTLGSLHEPTLAFQYRTDSSDNRFDVSITDGSGATTVYDQADSADWSRIWIDVTAWADQTITVKFNFHQEMGAPYGQLFLDDISLGSWATPIIDTVTPGELREFAGDLISISGENFLDGVTVLLGDTPVEDVTYLDEHALTFNLPAEIGIGQYDVWVVNPGGQPAAKPGTLRLGWLTTLPLIRR